MNSANFSLLSEVTLEDNYPASHNISFFGLFGIGCQDSALDGTFAQCGKIIYELFFYNFLSYSFSRDDY